MITAVAAGAEAADGSAIARINILAYEPAYGIIGDPAKKDPTTRQSADHSMAYIVACLTWCQQQAGQHCCQIVFGIK